MAQELYFEIEYDYNTLETGIVLPAILRLGDESSDVRVKLDTGSTFCVFERIHAERLGLEIETGIPLRISTVTAGFLAYGHTVNLSVLGFETESTVYFAAEESFSVNVLGRNGFLDRVKLGLIDYEGKLLLSVYNQ